MPARIHISNAGFLLDFEKSLLAAIDQKGARYGQHSFAPQLHRPHRGRMNKVNRNVVLACAAFLGIAGASIGTGYAAWIYSNGDIAAQNAVVNAGVGIWKYLEPIGAFYAISGGTIDWNTIVQTGGFYSGSTNTIIKNANNPASTMTAAVYPFEGKISGTTYQFVGVEGASSSDYPYYTAALSSPAYVPLVYLPSSYNSIGTGAFALDTALTHVGFVDVKDYEVPIATSLAIGNYAFYGDNALSAFAFPAISTTIGDYAFSECALQSADLSYVTTIGEGAFWSNTMLASLTLNPALQSLGSYAFSGASKLTSVTIPSAITTIDSDTFSSCTKLSSVTLSSSTTKIKDGAFYQCPSLTSITLPATLTKIDSWAFGLDNVRKPLNITFQGTRSQWNTIVANAGANWNKNRTVRVKFSNSMQTVNSTGTIAAYLSTHTSNATEYPNMAVTVNCTDGTIDFLDSSNQYEITLNENAAALATSPVYTNNSNLIGLTLNAANSNIPDSLFSGDSNLSFFDASATTDLVVGNSAFANLTNLATCLFPSSLTSIGSNAFYSCTSLSDANLSSSTPLSIGDNAFQYCTALTSVSLNAANSLVLGASAFNHCSSIASLSATSTNSSVTLGASAFAYCNAMSQATVNAVGAVDIGDTAFQSCPGLTTLTVASTTSSAALGANVCNSCSALATVNVSSIGALSIGNSAFKSDGGLTSLTLNSGSTLSLGTYAFGSCVGLTTTALSSVGAATLGNNAFDSCSALTSIDLSNLNNLTLGMSCFNKADALGAVSIAASAVSIGRYAFNVSNTNNARRKYLLITYGGTKNQFRSIIYGDYRTALTNRNAGYLRVYCSGDPATNKYLTY